MKGIVLYFVDFLLKFMSGSQGAVVEGYLKFHGDADTNGGFNNTLLVNIINTIWDYFRLAGMGIAIIYFLMELNNKMGFESGNVTMKTFVMPFCKLALAILMLSYSPTLMSNMFSINDGFIDAVNGISVTSTTSTETGTDADADAPDPAGIKEKVEKSGLLTQIGYLLPLLLAWLIGMITNLIWIYKALAYKIELVFKISLTPLAIVDCYNTNSTAVIRWVKSVLGLVIYGGCLMLLSRLAFLTLETEAFSPDTTFWDWFLSLAKCFVMPFVMLGVSGTIKQVCKEALS